MGGKFHSDFWRRSKADRDVLDALNRVPSNKRTYVVRLLEIISDPGTARHIKRNSPQLNANILSLIFPPRPTRKALRNLVRRLETISRDLNSVDISSGLAENCRTHAKYLKMAIAMAADSPKPPRTVGYKSFWKHVPLAMLCRLLDVPLGLSFAEIETLVRFSYAVRGRSPDLIRTRSIEREFKRLMHPTLRDPLSVEALRVSRERTIDALLAALNGNKTLL